jgi:hypothetical protein
VQLVGGGRGGFSPALAWLGTSWTPPRHPQGPPYRPPTARGTPSLVGWLPEVLGVGVKPGRQARQVQGQAHAPTAVPTTSQRHQTRFSCSLGSIWWGDSRPAGAEGWVKAHSSCAHSPSCTCSWQGRAETRQFTPSHAPCPATTSCWRPEILKGHGRIGKGPACQSWQPPGQDHTGSLTSGIFKGGRP